MFLTIEELFLIFATGVGIGFAIGMVVWTYWPDKHDEDHYPGHGGRNGG